MALLGVRAAANSCDNERAKYSSCVSMSSNVNKHGHVGFLVCVLLVHHGYLKLIVSCLVGLSRHQDDQLHLTPLAIGSSASLTPGAVSCSYRIRVTGAFLLNPGVPDLCNTSPHCVDSCVRGCQLVSLRKRDTTYRLTG